MKKRPGNVLTVLARARPARLDSGAALRANWPTSDQLIAAAELAGDNPVPSLDPGEPRVQRRPLVPAKLLGAMTSAAVTAVVIAVAVLAGAVVLSGPHGQPTTAPSSSVTSGEPIAGRLVFQSLPLGPHWHGHAAYAVSNGVVYLAGTATLDNLGSRPGPVATLPSSARPAGQLELVAIVSAAAGRIDVGADGEIDVVAFQGEVTSVSFSGIAFAVGSR
jgi:hypothetical protein